MVQCTELFYARLKYSFEHNIRGEKLWLASLIHRSVEDVKKRITDYLSTMIIVYSLFCVFSVSDMITPINIDNVIIMNFFLVNASIETYIMLTLLSSSSAIYLYVVIMPDDTDIFVHFITKFNYWISWIPLYGMLAGILLQIINIVFRLYSLNPTLVISQSILGVISLICGLGSIVRISYFIHTAFNEQIKEYLVTRLEDNWDF